MFAHLFLILEHFCKTGLTVTGTLTHLLPAKSLFPSLEPCRSVCGAETIQKATECCIEVSFQLGKVLWLLERSKKSIWTNKTTWNSYRFLTLFQASNLKLASSVTNKWSPLSNWNATHESEKQTWINPCCYRGPTMGVWYQPTSLHATVTSENLARVSQGPWWA